MTLWLDAQLPPALARWISQQPWGVDAVAVRELGLRNAPAIQRSSAGHGPVPCQSGDAPSTRLSSDSGEKYAEPAWFQADHPGKPVGQPKGLALICGSARIALDIFSC